jgi:hypothetical protein
MILGALLIWLAFLVLTVVFHLSVIIIDKRHRYRVIGLGCLFFFFFE